MSESILVQRPFLLKCRMLDPRCSGQHNQARVDPGICSFALSDGAEKSPRPEKSESRLASHRLEFQCPLRSESWRCVDPTSPIHSRWIHAGQNQRNEQPVARVVGSAGSRRVRLRIRHGEPGMTPASWKAAQEKRSAASATMPSFPGYASANFEAERIPLSTQLGSPEFGIPIVEVDISDSIGRGRGEGTV